MIARLLLIGCAVLAVLLFVGMILKVFFGVF
jgi:hypothetical protein